MVMKTTYRWTANAVFVAHVLIGVFFLIGWMFKDIQFVYLPVLVAWPLSGLFFGYCPLTKLELRLRKLENPTTDTSAGFIQSHMQKVFGMHVPRHFIRAGIILIFFILLTLSIAHNFTEYA